MKRAALIDIDGTLVDTNYHHALAWYRAFRDHGVTVPVWRLHRAIGMGGDKLIEAVAGEAVEQEEGDALRDGHTSHFSELIDETAPLPGATEFLARLHEAGWTTVLATSAGEPDIQHYLDLLEARELVDGWTGADDVDASKPSPDIIEAALEKADARPGEAVMIGDSIWDVKAAERVGVQTVCVLTGGFSAAELLDAGASEVLESLGLLQERLLAA